MDEEMKSGMERRVRVESLIGFFYFEILFSLLRLFDLLIMAAKKSVQVTYRMSIILYFMALSNLSRGDWNISKKGKNLSEQQYEQDD